MMNLLWAIAAILVVLWILGFALNVGAGGIIHLLLVLAIVAVVARLFFGRATV